MIGSIVRRLIRAGGTRYAIKAAKSRPVVGTAAVIGLAGYEIKRKGVLKGLLNVALDATPVLGVVKNSVEMVTGDWLPDKEDKKEHETPEKTRMISRVS
jgi:hypothetical protein